MAWPKKDLQMRYNAAGVRDGRKGTGSERRRVSVIEKLHSLFIIVVIIIIVIISFLSKYHSQK